MNRFESVGKKKKILESVPFSVIIFVVIMAVFLCAVSYLSKSNALDDKRILEDAIQRDVAHCYAVEGSYPASVAYMEENYGLTYDHSKYIVDYELVGSNIYPNIMVVEIRK